MHRRRDLAFFALGGPVLLLAGGLGAVASSAQAQAGRADPPDLAQALRRGGCALLWRHAQTVRGIGDPPGFRLDQCATQRNLSEEGREQARVAGAWFKAQGLAPHAVRSSAWCRCKDTADLAFGRHEVWPPLSSTFNGVGDAEARASRQAMLRELAIIPPGQFEVWVTHQVNITALTELVPAMGEALVVNGMGRVTARGVPA